MATARTALGVGRLRSSSRGLNSDEQKTDTAELLNGLAFGHQQTATSSTDPDENDEFLPVAETAERVRLQLADQSSSKDIFRHGAGFEKVLEVLDHIPLRLSTPHHQRARRLASCMSLIRRLLRLLSEALREHHGNERYFSTHLDGWEYLRLSFIAIQQVFLESLPADDCSRELASLYDSLLGFASFSSPQSYLSSWLTAHDASNKHAIPPASVLEHPHGCATALTLGLRALEAGERVDEAILILVSSVFRWASTLAAASTRNLNSIWQTGVLAEVQKSMAGADVPETLKHHLRVFFLTVGRYGLNDLNDVALLFQRASHSDAARGDLLSLVHSSKEPAFIQFDLERFGFSSLEVPSLRSSFPPPVGYALTAWVRVDEYDAKSHTTLFGLFDSSHKCFILMYLEKDSHQLILQTSVRAPNPSIRFKSTRFESGRWYHLAVVQRKSSIDPSQSNALLFVDGQFVEQRKCSYPESPDTKTEQRTKSVQAFFGTGRDVAANPAPNEVRTKWSLANAHLYAVALTDEFVAVHHRLGPRYRGNLQDCLGPLLTYRASSELHRYNETLHPDKSDRSDIMTATEGRGSDVVSEVKLLLAIDPASVIDFGAPAASTLSNKHDFDGSALSRYQRLMQRARAIAINTAVPSVNEAIGRSYGTGVMTGDPIVVVPQPIDDATWSLSGSLPTLRRLLESATSKTSFLEATEIFLDCVKDNWRISEAMEKGSGFGILSMIIREKLGLEVAPPRSIARQLPSMLSFEDRQTLPLELLHLVLDFVGYRRHAPETSMLVNPMAYRVLLIDFDTWRRCGIETQTLYYQQFTDFILDNRNTAFNQKRLIRVRAAKKLIEALKTEDIKEEGAAQMMCSLKALLDSGPTVNMYRELVLFVAWGLHDARAMPSATIRSFASTVALRQRIGSWPASRANSSPSTPGGMTAQQSKLGMSRFELAVMVLKFIANILNDDMSSTAVRRFNKSVPNKWLLHLLAESDARVVELTLSIIAKVMSGIEPDAKTSFSEKDGGFITLRSRLKPFWTSSDVWTLTFAIFFGRTFPLLWLGQGFTAFHLVELLSVDDKLSVRHPEMLPSIFAMLEAGLRKVATGNKQMEAESALLGNVLQFLGELYSRSTAFRDFAVNSRYLQEILFVLFPLLAGTDRLSAETELQSEALSFKGEEVKVRPHSNSAGERPPSIRSVDMGFAKNGTRTPSPMAANRVSAPQRLSSFVLVNDRKHIEPASFSTPMAPKVAEPIKIDVTNALVEGLLELAITLFTDQVCYKDKFNGIGLFLKVPPGFREYQAYFESYVLVNALSQLNSHLRLHQDLLQETRVLTNLARHSQHMAEAVSEGWFIDGAQPLLDFSGELLEHLQQPNIANVKSVRLCSQSVNSIRIVFLKATLWRLAELNEDASEQDVGTFLNKMTYWQTILFSPENQETLFTKLICYLLYHKLVSSVSSVRLAAARLWRMVLVQKPTETATMLTNTMGPEQRHLSTGFMKLISMDDEDFLRWVDSKRSTLDTLFHSSLSKPWEDFVQAENRSSEETTRARLNKRRDKLRVWQTEESAVDDCIHDYDTSTSHWRSNVHAQERVKLQRALQDHHESVNHLQTAFAKIDKQVAQPCGLEPAVTARWQLDETEAVNRMRIRTLPDTTEIKETFQPKRKASQLKAKASALAVDTQLSRAVSIDIASPIPPTPGSPATASNEDSRVQPESGRARSDSVSNSQLLEGEFEMVEDPQIDEDGLVEDKNRKVMTSLQRGDQVQQLYNISRIVGLEACEGLLVVGKKCLYMQDNFFQRSDGEIVSVSQAPDDERDPYVQLISGKDVGSTRTKHSVGDQETRNWTWTEVLSLSKRRFLLRDVAIEVFFSDGRSYLITCMTSKIRDDLYNGIVSRAPHVHSTSAVSSEDAWRLDTLRNPEEAPKNIGSKLGSLFNSGPTHAATKKWQRGEMSNFQYLMLVNTIAGRTFNDLTQYPVFPWVLADYTSDDLDLEDPKTFRDFSKPMGCQTSAREAEFKDRYRQFGEMGDQNAPSFHYGTHYSSAMIVTSYLIRLQPFVQSYLLLQGGAFDHADRLFDSVHKAWLSASRDTMSDVRELIPEFFCLPEFLTNVNKYDFGTKQVSGEVVNNVKLPKWAKDDPQVFIAKHREALESRYMSERLPDWIDLIFGYKQRGEAAIEATNVFHHLSYAGAKDLDKIDDRIEQVATIGIIHSFGQTPHQVFQKPHPTYELETQAEPKLDTLVETLVRLPEPEMKLGEQVADFTLAPIHLRLLTSGPGKLNVLPDCTRVLQWGYGDNSIRFFSSHTKRALGLYENTHIGPITTATFADSKTLISGGQDCTIGIWKVTASKNLVEIAPKTYLYGHRSPITILAASRVFSTLLSASANGQVLIWGLNRFECIRVLLPAGGPPIRAARVSNVSGHIMICRESNVLIYTLNGHLLVEQKLCDRDEEEILCCAFYEGAGNEYMERELLFTGHAHGVTNAWKLATLDDGSWHLQLVKSMHHAAADGSPSAAERPHAITAVLPLAREVYTGDQAGNVWKWECIVRGSSVSAKGR